MKVCANLTFLFKENGNLILRYAAAQKSGFKYVESDFPKDYKAEDISKALEENNLSQVLMNAYHGDSEERGFAAIPEAQTQFKESIEKTLVYLLASNCKRTHIMSGMSLGAEKFDDQLNTMIENLRWVAEKFKKYGIIGLIEPINPISVPGYFLNSFDTARHIIDKVDSPNVKLQLDLFHLQLICGNVTNNLKELLPFTGHIQIAQSPHRHEPSFPGELNMDYILSCIKLSGYTGYIGCEYVASAATSDCFGWIQSYGLEF